MNGLRLCCKQHEIRDPYPLVLMAQTACNVILWGIFCLAHHGTLSTDHSLTILMGCGDEFTSQEWHCYFLGSLYVTLEELKVGQTGFMDIKTTSTLRKCTYKVMRIKFY